MEETSTALPHADIRQVRVEKDRLFVLTKESELFIYAL